MGEMKKKSSVTGKKRNNNYTTGKIVIDIGTYTAILSFHKLCLRLFFPKLLCKMAKIGIFDGTFTDFQRLR